MGGRFKVYLAGPERLLIDGREINLQKRALCSTYGFECLPLEDNVPESERSEVGVTYAKCLALMLRADIGIFNLTPVAGTAPDASTGFKLGMMSAIGKPVYAYLNEEGERLPASHEIIENSIIGSCFAMQNRTVIRTLAAAKDRFSYLGGLEFCLIAAKREFTELGR